jgi:phospholipase/lecithinase/hemolysin
LRDAALQAAAQSYRDVIKRLADAGAKTFVVANVPDFGVSPEAIYIYNKASAASDATRSFNRYADRMLERLAEQQDLTLARVDFFGLMDAIIHDATYQGGATFGITNVNTPCLDVPAWFAGGVIPGAGTSSCDVSLWADYHHPTAKVHALMGNAAAACRIGHRDTIATSPQAIDDLLHPFCEVLH